MFFSKRSTTPKQIINALLKREKSLTELSEDIGISKQALLKHLNQLEHLGFIQSRPSPEDTAQKSYSLISKTVLLSIDEAGFAISCSNPGFLDEDYPLLIQIPQQEFRIELRKHLSKIDEKNSGDLSAIIYGSVALGKAGKESDIDLSLIKSSWRKDESEKLMDELSDLTVKESLPHSLSLTFHTYEELESPDHDIQREIVENGMLIYNKTPEHSDFLWQTLKRYKNI